MIVKKACQIFLLTLCGPFLCAQELKVFTKADFELRGKVKSCQVITGYGKEVFEFDRNGVLTKSVTQYNDTDQDISYYKYDDGNLVEKRLESYKDGVLDAATSMANIYVIDTTGTKNIQEKIVSYDKTFLELQEYQFDEEGRLVKLTTSHQNAVDEIVVEYSNYKDEATKTYFLNGVIQKSIRSSKKKDATGKIQELVLTKEFVDGMPSKAMELLYDPQGTLLSEEVFMYDGSQEQFVSKEKQSYRYSAMGFLSKTFIRRGNAESLKEFIFQFDDSEQKNWVKKIMTPDNTYTTRKIEYYTEAKIEERPN
ncbi:MAG: hypothetical protein AAGB24_05015 [Bacteroidota bacterium]